MTGLLPTSGSGPIIPSLTSLWNHPAGRHLVSRAVASGVFRHAPESGESFLREIDAATADVGDQGGGDRFIFPSLRRSFELLSRDVPEALERERGASVERRALQITSLLGDFQPRSLLDIGCGPGDIAIHAGRALGLSAESIYGADVVSSEKSWLDGARFLLYDGMHLPLPDDAVDLVTILAVLHHAENPAAVLSEARRVLKPGGKLLVRELDATTILEKAFQFVMDLLWYNVFSIQPDVPNPGHFQDEESWHRMIAGAGFAHLRTEPVERDAENEFFDNPYRPFFSMWEK